MKFKKVVAKLLMAFVLVSIGFAMGKQTARQSGDEPETQPAPASQPAAGPAKVVVYYMHATFRCPTCNTAEARTEKLIHGRFGRAVLDGRLEWKPTNFQQHEELASRYDVIGTMVVVVRRQGDKDVEYKRLDRVLELASRPEEFDKYVGDAIRACLGE